MGPAISFLEVVVEVFKVVVVVVSLSLYIRRQITGTIATSSTITDKTVDGCEDDDGRFLTSFTWYLGTETCISQPSPYLHPFCRDLKHSFWAMLYYAYTTGPPKVKSYSVFILKTPILNPKPEPETLDETLTSESVREFDANNPDDCTIQVRLLQAPAPAVSIALKYTKTFVSVLIKAQCPS